MTMPRYSRVAAWLGGSQVMAQPPSDCWSATRRSRWAFNWDSVKRPAPHAVRGRRELQRRHAVRRIGRICTEERHLGQPVADPIKIDVVGVLEELQRFVERVRLGRQTFRQLSSAPRAGQRAPRVVETEFVQPADQAGGRVETGLIGPLAHVLSARIVLDHRRSQRDRTFRSGYRSEPVDGSANHHLVPRTGGQQDVERGLDIQSEAVGSPLVRLQAVPETTVRVLIPTQRVDDPSGISALEDGGEQPLLDQPGLAPYEITTCGEDVHTPELPARAARLS